MRQNQKCTEKSIYLLDTRMIFYSEHGTLIWIVIESMQPRTKLVHLGLGRENTDRSPRWNQTKIEPIRKTITYIVANNFQVYKIPPSISLLGYVDMGYDEKNSIIIVIIVTLTPKRQEPRF